MPFISVQFLLFIFFVILIYFIVPGKVQWIVLLVSSYIYFFINSEWLILILFAETMVTFLTGLWIDRQTQKDNAEIANLKDSLSKEEKKQMQSLSKKKRKAIMLTGVLLVLLTLIFLKYYNFFIGIVSLATRRFGISFPHLNLLLPIGISFYSLQAIAYMVDVYRGKIRADTNLLKFMLFMSYFPQIVQGPIPRYKQLAAQLTEPHRFDYQRFCYGLQLILWGFMKKMIIADRIAIPVNMIFNHPGDYQGMIIFFALAGYGIQVYTDFSGGMDIARGFSQIIGIEQVLNFTQPYFAISVEDFWRRWHITLGSFMRDYVFYPLSLSKLFNNIGKKTRKIFGNSIGKKIPPFIAMFIVYFLVGFWHGSQWKYVAYGIWNGFFIAGGILLTDVFSKGKQVLHINESLFSWRLFQMVRTFIIVSLGRVFPRAFSLKEAIKLSKALIAKWYDFAFIFDGTMNKLGIKTADWILLLISVFILLFVDYLHEKKVPIRESITQQGIVFETLLFIAGITAVILFGIYGPGFESSKFIYQQF